MWLNLVLLALLVIACVGAVRGEDCDGHGTIVDGKCVCSSARPAVDATGWVGDQCDVATYHVVPASGSSPSIVPDVTEACQCSFLHPKQRVCFFVEPVSLMANLGMYLNGTGNLDLEGWLVAQDSKLYPNTDSVNLKSFVASTPRTGCSESSASYYLSQQSLADGKYEGMYLCVVNSGDKDEKFALRVAIDGCPFCLSSSGNKTVCSGHGDCEGNECVCRDDRVRPQTAVYPGLGFEDCSASSRHLADPTTEHVGMQTPGTWHFFNFSLGDAAQDRYITASLTATGSTSSDVEMYMQWWQAPGREVGQYLLRSTPGDFRSSGHADLASSVHLDSSTAAYRAGPWFLGVFVAGTECVGYNLTLHRSPCPGGCSGDRGTCAPETGLCTCSKPEFVGPNCADTSAAITLATPVEAPARAGFQYDRYTLKLGDLLVKAPGKSLSLVVEASFSSGAPLPAWVTARPLLLAGASPDMGTLNATKRLTLQDAGTTYSLEVEAIDVPDGNLFLAIANPLDQPHQIGYKLAVRTKAACINGCNGHGTCGEDSGVCACQDGFMGPDCSVDSAALQQCTEGTLRPASAAPSNAKAYAVCMCTAPDQCVFTDATADSFGHAFVVCDTGFSLAGANPDAIRLSDGRTVPGGGSCKRLKKGTSGGMVFFYCLLSIVLFCALVVGSKFGLERYQIWRANQVGGYAELGTQDGKSLWDAFTGARRTNNDSW